MVRPKIIGGILAGWALIFVLWFYLAGGSRYYCSGWNCELSNGWSPTAVRIVIIGLIVGLVLASWLAFTIAADRDARGPTQSSKPGERKPPDQLR